MYARLIRFGFVPVVGLALIAAGCGGNGGGSKEKEKIAQKPAPAPMPSANTGAQLAVNSPAAGRVLTANSLQTGVSIRNFRVDCRYAGTPNRKGIGHYHIELDHKLVNMYCKRGASISMQNVKPGAHSLTFIPAENDHADDLMAEKNTKFTYRPAKPLAPETPLNASGKPSIRILSPKRGVTVHRSFDFTVAPKNFRFSCALYGKDNIRGYGHWHANVDSTSKGMMGMGTMLGMSCQRTFHVSLAGIKPGQHKFFAILEDDQHAPTPGAMASVSLNVR